MAIFHLDVKSISRSQGRSSVSAAAYRAGEKINDSRQGIEFDFSKKQGIAHSSILTPKNTPTELSKRASLWNTVESVEKRKDARLAQEIMIALPKELTLEQNIKLAEQFCKQELTDKGLIADLNLHFDNKENPHVHILIPTREINSEGFGKKHSVLRDIHFPTTVRRNWQDLANQKLFELGHDTRIDCRSLKDRGIDLEPNKHLGANVSHAVAKGSAVSFDLYQEYQNIIEANARRIIHKPEIGLKSLSDKQAYFSDYDIAKLASRNSNNLEQYHQVYNSIKNCNSLVEIGTNDFGKSVFTSKQNLAKELNFLETAAKLELTSGFKVSNKAIAQTVVNKGLNTKQAEVMSYILEPGNLKTVVGYAGSGKSYLMGACKEVWEQSGYSVKGGAFSGIASQALEESSGIQAKTIDSWLCSWNIGKRGLSKNDVFVVDEAAMLDTKKLASLTEHINSFGAKLVAIGDNEQCQPFGSGNPFKTLVHHMNRVGTLDTIYRQKDAKMQEATKLFGDSETKQALAIYAEKNCIHSASTSIGAKQAIIEAWVSEKQKYQNNSIILATENKDVNDLNKLARDVRILNKEIDNGKKYDVLDRANNPQNKNFSIGDRIYFLAIDNKIGVNNGSLGTIENIDKNNFKVVLDGKNKSEVNFNINDYKHVTHGYAATIYKSQGITVDKTYLYATKSLDKYFSYVACSRHKSNLEIIYSKTDFKNTNELINSISKSRAKWSAIDFAYGKNLNPNQQLNSGLSDYKRNVEAQLKQNNISLLELDNKVFAKAFDNVQGLVKNIVNLGGQKFLEIVNNTKSTLVECSKGMEKMLGNFTNLKLDHNNKIDNIKMDTKAFKSIEQNNSLEKLNLQQQQNKALDR